MELRPSHGEGTESAERRRWTAHARALEGVKAEALRTEVRMERALALYHGGEKPSPGGRVVFSSGGKNTLLGRIGYMGRRNPDLDGPK